MSNKIRVLFLDIDNTLLDFDAAAEWAMSECFSNAGLEYKPEMFDVFTEENNKIWQRIERKELSMDDLPYVRWQAITAKLGLKADGVAMEMEFRDLLKLSAVPIAGANEILAYLSERGYCLCAASNGPYNQQITRLKKADMLKYFTHCFISESIGADKPSEQFFDGCMKTLSEIHPEECMMIGDSLTADITGGRAYGMATCWYVPSKEKYLVEKNKEKKAADYIIHDLMELKDILLSPPFRK